MLSFSLWLENSTICPLQTEEFSFPSQESQDAVLLLHARHWQTAVATKHLKVLTVGLLEHTLLLFNTPILALIQYPNKLINVESAVIADITKNSPLLLFVTQMSPEQEQEKQKGSLSTAVAL